MSAQSASTTSIQARSAGISGLIARYQLQSFFILAFLGTWLGVLPLLLDSNRLGLLPVALPVELFMILGALAGPTLAAFIVSAATDGRAGVGMLLRRYVQWRANPLWYLLILVGPFFVLLLALGAIFGATPLEVLLQKWPILVPQYLLMVVLGAILGPLWEEGGWRGFALPRLQERYGALVASLILGALWALWHLPGIFGGWLPPQSFAGLVVGTVAFAVIFTWIYNNTGGSILLMILLHSATNAGVALAGQLLPADMPGWVGSLLTGGWLSAIPFGICALVIVAATRGKLK